MRIGNLSIGDGLLLAPMAGITNRVFRSLVRSYGAALVYTEMVSAMGIKQRQKKTLSLLEFAPDEHPIGAQIFGSDPQAMAEAAAFVESRGFDLVDLNLGCPSPKIVKRGEGSALLKDLPKCQNIFKAVTEMVSIPVTLKTRIGWSHEEEISPLLARIAQDCGIDAITVHARYTSDRFAGEIDLPALRRTKKAVTIPVFGNGDVSSHQAAWEMIKQTGCDGIMVGRGVLGKPWNLKYISQYKEPIPSFQPPAPKEIFQIMLQHTLANIQEFGTKKGLIMMRKHFVWYSRGLPFAKKIHQNLNKLTSYEELEDEIQSIMETF
ncbi:tRNA dihydrouridine synthase DusB [bacterium]|nr:tRNA dihydrouridine synthase DusB [bacterium]